MQLSTAFSALLIAGALFAAGLRKRNAVFAMGGVVGLIALISLVSNLLGLESVFLDRLVIEPFTQDEVYPAGRMSSASSVSFLCLVSAAVILALRSSLLQRSLASLFSALAMGYAVFSLSGYLGNVIVGYGWGILTGMSMVTATVVLLLSVAVWFYAWRGHIEHAKNSLSGMAVGTSVGLSILVILFAILLELNETTEIHQRADQEVEQLASETDRELNQTVRAIDRMARRIELDPEQAETHWRQDARAYVHDIPGLEMTAWVRDDGTTWHVNDEDTPYSGALVAEHVGLVKRSHGREHELDRRTFLAGPVNLADGHTGFLIVGEVRPLSGEDPGFVIGAIAPEAYLREFVQSSVWHEFDVEIHSPSGLVLDYETGSALDRDNFSVDTVLPAGDEEWRLVIAPTLTYVTSRRSRIAEAILIAGLILANLTGLSLQLAGTARRNSEQLEESVEQLALREERLANLVNALPDAVLTVSSTGEIEEVNPAAKVVFKCREDDLLGVRLSEILTENADDEGATELISRLKTNRMEKLFGKAYATLARRTDHTTFPVALSVAPFKTAEGRKFVWIIRDITRQVEAEQEIRRNAEELHEWAQRYEKLKTCGAIGMAHVGLDGCILECNETFAELLGYSVKELERRSIAELNYPDDADEADRLIRELVKGERDYYRITKRYLHRDGRPVWVDVAVALLRDKEGKPLYAVGIALDITERKLASEVLQDRERQLRAVNKELESIVYVASHDLRSPLVNLQGFSRQMGSSAKRLQELLGNGVLSEELKSEVQPLLERKIPEALEFIESSTVKMDRLIKGLLRLSRLGRIELRPKQVDMNALMQEVVNSMQFMLTQHKIEVEVGDLPPCWGDEDQLNQVFSNLVDNAIKYRSHERDSVIRISGERQDDQVEYVVEDNGVGIDPRHQQIIFEVFHRLKPKDGVGGEGLGLSVVRRILDRSNGSISVESEEGKGSRFVVTLKAVTQQAAHA